MRSQPVLLMDKLPTLLQLFLLLFSLSLPSLHYTPVFPPSLNKTEHELHSLKTGIAHIDSILSVQCSRTVLLLAAFKSASPGSLLVLWGKDSDCLVHLFIISNWHRAQEELNRYGEQTNRVTTGRSPTQITEKWGLFKVAWLTGRVRSSISAW